MRRIIHYNQIIQKYDDKGEKTGEEKIYLSVESDNEKDYTEQLATVKTYCDDWTVEIDKDEAIQYTKKWVEKQLFKGMVYEGNGKTYTITAAKQQQLSQQLIIGNMLKEQGISVDNIKLKWNASGEECTDWCYTDLCKLSYAISQYIEPIVAKQQKAEILIKGAEKNDSKIEEILRDFV